MKHILVALAGLALLLACEPSATPIPRSDATPTDMAQPDAAPPDAARPDAGLSDAGLVDAALPDAALSDAELPDAALPDAELPDAELPDAEQPDAELPDAELADAERPDAEQPPPNRPPQATEDDVSTAQNTAVVIEPLSNDTDPDGDALTLVEFTQPEHGAVAQEGATLTYTPAPSHYGADAFEYTVADPEGLTAVGLVQITVLEDPIERAIRTGEVGAVSERALLGALTATDQASRAVHRAHWQAVFALDAAGAPTMDTPRAMQWNPSHDSVQLAIGDTSQATAILISDDAAKRDDTLHTPLAVVGEHHDALRSRYAVFGANPFHDLMREGQPGGSGNADLSQALHNTIQWLGRGQLPQRVVIAHTTDSHYFRHDDTTPRWFAQALPDAALNDEDTCENDALAACLAEADLLVISQDTWERDTAVAVVVEAVVAAQRAGLPVLYVQSHRDLSPLGERLMTWFGLTVENNYWRQEQLAAVDPVVMPAFDALGRLVETLAQDTLAYADYEPCVGENDSVPACNAAPFVQQLVGPLRVARAQLGGFSERATPLFSVAGYRFLKLLVLLGDRYRVGEPGGVALSYPIDWQNDPATFARAVLADHTVVYPRATAPAQPDLGTFVCPNPAYADGTCTGYDIAAAPRAEHAITQVVPARTEWTTTGLYILPGHPIVVTRTDDSAAPIALRFNSHWAASTRSLQASRGRSKYDRPQFLSSPYISLRAGEAVTLTSPYGGAVYLQVKGSAETAGQVVTATVANVGRHAALLDLADEAQVAAFLTEVRDNPIPYVDLRSTGFESHLRKDRFVNPADTLYEGDLAHLFEDYRENFVGTVYRLAGFAAPGATVQAGLSAELLALCDALQWDCTDGTLHRRDAIQHANFDGTARCGSGCSGNPFDGNWDLDPIGWGNSHELGHNLQVKPLRVAWMPPADRNNWHAWANRAGENSNNLFPYYTRWHYERVVLGNDAEVLDGHMNHKDLWAVIQSDLAGLTRIVDGAPERVVFDARCRVQGTGPADAANLRVDAIWADSSYAADNGLRMSFYLQLPLWFHQRPLADGVALANGFDIIPLLYAQQRLFRAAARAEETWNAARDGLGFSSFAFAGDATYGGDRVKDIWANDFMLVSLSFVSGWDFRPYFDLRGVPYTDLAAAQIERHIDSGRVSHTVGTGFAVLETELPRRDLMVDWVALDGVSAWPSDGFHPRSCLP